MIQNHTADRARQHQDQQPDDPVARQLKHAGLQVGLFRRRHSSHLFKVLRRLLLHDVHDIVNRDNTDEPHLTVHHRQRQQIVFVEQRCNLLLVLLGQGIDDIVIHDILNLRLIRIHQEILERHDAHQLPLRRDHIAGIDRLLVDAVLPDIAECFLYRHRGAQRYIFGGHDGAGAVLRILQVFVDQVARGRRRDLQDTLHDRCRQLLHHIDRVIDGQILKDAAQLRILNAVDNVVLLLDLHGSKNFRRKILRQQPEHHQSALGRHLAQQLGNVHLIHVTQLFLQSLELPAVKKAVQLRFLLFRQFHGSVPSDQAGRLFALPAGAVFLQTKAGIPIPRLCLAA